jgi:tetratricopeptide (TPR) repeat protein
MSETNWLPGIVVLGISLLVGLVFVARSRRSDGRPTHSADDRLEDLDGRAQLLLDQLKELNADRHHLEPKQFAVEKNRLEQEAAVALRERDQYLSGSGRRAAKAAAAPSEQKPTSWLGRHPQFKGALWGGALVLFFVVLGLLLSHEQNPRGEGGTATGRTPPMQSTADSNQAMPDPALKDAIGDLQAHPDSLDAMARAAHELINHQEWEEANRLTERALGIDPFHTENRIHRAVLLAIRGDGDKATKDLQHLVDAYPDAHEGLLFLGALAMKRGEKQQALRSFERYLAEAPPAEQPPQLRDGILLLRKQLGLPSP